MILFGWLGKLTSLFSRRSAPPADKPPEKPPDRLPSTEPVQAEALKQMSTAVTWLIGALAAVAAAMIAGSQLTSIGKLSADTDRRRLIAAGVSIAVAVGLVLFAIGLLYRAQAPTNTDFDRLRKLAAGQGDGHDEKVRQQVAADSALHQGTGSLTNLMAAFDDLRADFHRVRNKLYRVELAAARAPQASPPNPRKQRLEAELDVLGARMSEYRLSLLRVAQLDKFQRTRDRYRRSSWLVLVLAVLSSLAFVSFAWAANPPSEPAEAKPATSQQPVAAHLRLDARQVSAYQARLGAACATAAATGAGIPVLAVSSDSSGVTVLVVPGGACPDANQLTVPTADGSVVADAPVLPTASPTAGPS